MLDTERRNELSINGLKNYKHRQKVVFLFLLLVESQKSAAASKPRLAATASRLASRQAIYNLASTGCGFLTVEQQVAVMVGCTYTLTGWSTD